MRSITLCLLIWFAFLESSIAITPDGKYATYGHGGESCGAYLEALNKGRSGRGYNEENLFTIWVRGYLTAYNRYTKDTYSILGNTDLVGAMAYIENYCRKEPLQNFSEAVASLVDELYSKRRKSPRTD